MAHNSLTSSSLSRYQPAVLTISGLLAAFGCYAFYRSYQTEPPHPLHRSNAVYRRRRSPRAEYPRESEHTSEISERELARDQRVAPSEVYGTMAIEVMGTIHIRPLTRANVASVEALRAAFQLPNYEFTEEQLRSFQGDFAYRWLLRHCSPGASRENMTENLVRFDIAPDAIEYAINKFEFETANRTEVPPPPANSVPNEDTRTLAGTELSDAAGPSTSREGQNLKQMLYYIAEHQSREEGYVHRGVKCNQCDSKPIRGIRWRCANCADYDLCSDCEAQSMHDKTHLFYKVRIPAPFLGNPRQSQPVIYPGRPQLMLRSLRHDFRQRMVKETEFELHEVDAYYDQFSCLADERWEADPSRIGAAINRRAFDKTFTPLSSVTPPKPNLIYDRMFAFYDVNRDGLIGFEEFLKGLATLYGKMKDVNKLRKVFDGYDIDEDGFVSRKDFLRMFRAFYAIQKEITHDLLAVQQAEEDLTVDGSIDLISSSQPLSAAFGSPIPPGDRITHQKSKNDFGDKRDGQVPTQEDGKDQINRAVVVGNAWELNAGFPLDRDTGDPISMSGMSIKMQSEDGKDVTREVEFTYNGRPVNEARNDVLKDRWQRRRFYTDEEEGAIPPDHLKDLQESDNVANIEDDVPRPDEANHLPGISNVESSEDHGAASANHTSSAKTPLRKPDEVEKQTNYTGHSKLAERLRKYKIPEAEKDFGKDVLYQVTQQGINELLDPLFKQKEDLAMAAYVTKIERRKWRQEIKQYLEQRQEEQRRAAMEAADPLIATATAADSAEKMKQDLSKDTAEAVSDVEKKVQDQSLDELLEESGYSVLEETELQDRLQRSMSPSPELAQDTPQLPNGVGSYHEEQDEANQSRSGVAEAQVEHHSQDALHQDDDKENVDPTLPHMRPSTPTALEEEPSQSSRSHAGQPRDHNQENISTELRDELNSRFAFMVLGKEPPHGLSKGSLNMSDGKIKFDIPAPEPQPSEPVASDGPPSGDRLKYLAELSEVEREIGARGGPGRLSYEEFERFMNSDAGRRIGYVEGWLELGSF